MKHIFLLLLLFNITAKSNAQILINPKGTKIAVDSSKWTIIGNNIYNKNSGNVGIGTSLPTAQLHTTLDVRFEGIGINTLNTKILTTDNSGNVTSRLLSNLLSGSAITSLNGLTTSSQTFATGTTGTNFNIVSTGTTHTFNLPDASSLNRGALTSLDWNTFNGKENSLSFSTGLTRTINTITVNTSQNINTLSNLTTNGLIKTSGGTGALSIATVGTDYSAGTSALASGILKSTTGTGALSIAIASDFPILNQNTTGSAATLTTPRSIYGGSFNGSADVTNIISSNFGGTGNGFTKFTGPTTAEKIFILPNANATILTDNSPVTVAQGGTGQTSYTNGQLLIGNTTGNTLTKSTLTAGSGISVTNAGGSITIANLSPSSGGTVTSVSVLSANGFVGTVANPTTTPQITLSTDVSGILRGDGTTMSAATPGIDYTDGTDGLATGILKSTSGTGTISIAIASDFPTLNQNTLGNAATVTTNANLTGPVTSLGNATSVANNAITNSMLAQVPAQIFKGRTTTGVGNVEDLTIAQAKTLLNITGTNSGDQTINLIGDVTGTGTTNIVTTISNNSVTNAYLSQIPSQTFKGRTTSSTGNVEDLTIFQAKALLNLTGTNSGDQTITLTGDVTGTGIGSFATSIGIGAVTYSKIQNVSASNKVLGRTSAGAGVVEEIATTGSGSVVRSISPSLVTPTGIVKGDVGLGNVDNTSDVNKPISTATQTALNLKISLTEKAANNGVATLDAGGKVPASQLPVGSQIYKGTWNAATNTPTLADGTGTAGWTYRVVVGGTIDLGSGNITFVVGDDVIYNGTIWERIPSSSAVTSVNTQTGDVVLTTDNISEGATNKYYTDTRARSSLSVSTPLVYNSSTGAFSIPLATTSTNGYLSSSDWNTFNGKQASGNYISALTGDVTAVGPGSATSTIANNAVTYGKMQTMTANKLLGSGLIGTAVAEISLGTGLSFTGTTLNAATTGGTVTSVSIVSANGFGGTVANATTTPAITVSTSVNGFLKGNGTSVAAAIVSDFPTLNQNTTGNAATVTTNANLTGPVTSIGNATSITNNAVTNAMLSQIATQTFKGRTSAATGNVEDLTATQATAMLNIFTSGLNGLVPSSGGGTSTYLRADGTFASPSGGNYRNLVLLSSDVINNNSIANTLTDVTGLSFSVTSGVTYHFYVLIPYSSAATTTGSRWTINAPTTTLLNYTSRYTLAATTQTLNFASAIGIPAACNATSQLKSIAIIEGVIIPSASGTVIIRFASEIANSAITAKAGASLEWW
ncbi:MAG: hypothetical protein ABI851_06085 [Saprospiraceae bacterium]